MTTPDARRDAPRSRALPPAAADRFGAFDRAALARWDAGLDAFARRAGEGAS